MASNKKTAIEDDVDDLDDVLEQFTAPSTSTAKPSAQSNPQAAEQNEVEVDDEDFAKHFAAEMEAFMKSISDPASATADSLDPKVAHEAEALRKAWEQMLIDDLEGNEGTSTDVRSGTTATKADGAPGSEVPFQTAVKQAMEKLKESDDSNKADEGDSDIAALLSAFSGLSADGEGGGDMQGTLETLMGQLMSKEILYEPLKELHEKFPGYLEANKSQLSKEDQSRYEKQNQIVAKVIAIFETPNYSDTNPTTTAEIVGLMSEMQEYGSPPTEIMGALPPGIDMGADGLPALDDKCIIA